MKIFVIGDVHGKVNKVESLLKQVGQQPDLLCLTGDLGGNWLYPGDPSTYQEGIRRPSLFDDRNHRYDKYKDGVRNILDKCRELCPKVPIVYIPGNHDVLDIHTFVSTKDVHDLSVGTFKNEHLCINGWPAAPNDVAFPSGFNDDMPRVPEIQDMMDEADIFISHCPPHGVLDSVVPWGTKDFQRYLELGMPSKNCGSELIKEMLDHTPRDKERLFLCGHIHESVGWLRDDKILYINAGSLAEPYATGILWMVEFDLESRTFSDPERFTLQLQDTQR